jgi:hypothetical protein
MKLSTSFTPTPRRKETLTLGTYTIPTIEQDHASDDYRAGIPSLMQPFEIYGQILVQFAPPGIRPRPSNCPGVLPRPPLHNQSQAHL